MEKPENTPAAAPQRIVVSISRRSSYWSTARESSEEVISYVLRLLGEDDLVLDKYDDPASCLFLAKERWDQRTYIIFDIFHTSYEPDTAHLPDRNSPPVTLIHLGRTGKKVHAAPVPITKKVNRKHEEIHNLTGLGSRPPFIVDHADDNYPTYCRPRTCIVDPSEPPS